MDKIDRQIAEKVFKIKQVERWACRANHLFTAVTGFKSEKEAQGEFVKYSHLYTHVEPYLYPKTIKKYSTNIAHAFEVVEKMHRIADFFLTYHAVDTSWEADFSTDNGTHCVEADTPSLAICLAALEAVKGQE